MTETVVFVHGYLGGGAQWDGQQAALSDRFHIVTPDLPGFGANHAMAAPTTIEGFAGFVLSQLSDLGLERFHLVGHSMGGMVVQEMVARAAERVDALVLYGTGPVGLLPGRFESIDESKRRVTREGSQATARRIAATWFLDGAAASGHSLAAAIAEQASEQAALAGLSAMEAWSGRAALPHIKSRSLVIWGDQDRSYAWSQPEELWRTIPDAQLAVVPGCAHAVHLEKPELFNAILMDFLDGHDPGTQSARL